MLVEKMFRIDVVRQLAEDIGVIKFFCFQFSEFDISFRQLADNRIYN